MATRTHTGFLLIVLAAGLASCERASPSPAAPSTAQLQQPPRPAGSVGDTYSVADVNLSGVVYEVTPMGRVPIEGVRVQLDYFHVFPTPDVMTDSNGFFSFRRVWVCACSWAPWVDAGITSIYVDKDGYKAPAGQPASVFSRRPGTDVRPDDRLRDVTITGDTRFDIELVRR
jgi:hypothetical protein